MRHYDNVIVAGRAVSAVFGTFTVILLVFLGIRLYNPTVGLLAGFLLAACVLHVQNSHFMTTDVFLTFMVTLALYFLVGVVQRGRTRDYVYAGLTIGLATATKFSALPLLAPLGVGVSAAHGRGAPHPARAAQRRLLAVLCIALAFTAGQPYALLDFPNYLRDIDEQSRMVRQAGLLPYTNQYIGVPKYGYDLLTQLVLWGMAPALGLVALWATASRVVGAVRERSRIDLVLLAWVVPFFLITGWFEVKFVRYLLPIYPIMILWAAAWLYRIAQSSRVGRLALWTVVGATALSTLAFLSIYMRPHTVVTASEWAVPPHPGRQDHPDPALGRGLPDAAPDGGNPGKYKVIDLPYYEPDTPGKWKQISEQLAGARLHGLPDQAALRRADHGAGEVPDQQQVLLHAVRRRPRLHADLRLRLAPRAARHRVPGRARRRVVHGLRPSQGHHLREHRAALRRRALQADHAGRAVEEADPHRSAAGAGGRARHRAGGDGRADPLQPRCPALVRHRHRAART